MNKLKILLFTSMFFALTCISSFADSLNPDDYSHYVYAKNDSGGVSIACFYNPSQVKIVSNYNGSIEIQGTVLMWGGGLEAFRLSNSYSFTHSISTNDSSMKNICESNDKYTGNVTLTTGGVPGLGGGSGGDTGGGDGGITPPTIPGFEDLGQLGEYIKKVVEAILPTACLALSLMLSPILLKKLYYFL